ncbi:MAG: NADH-quinone oxidoreductase subunit H [Candidatus Margulisiibacteriota bacterium]
MALMDSLIHLLLLVAFAPLANGIITKVKNNLRLRQGPGILQPYRNLIKLFGKEEIIPESSSWIFRITPFIVFATSVTMVLLLGSGFGRVGDLLVVIFVLALGRFFQALAALDAGSSFGGMGASREMFVSSFVEPAACLIIFALYLSPGVAWSVSHFLAGLALLLVLLAETSRLPVDNQETHLELTMIHEAMLLDYSGPSLALIEWSVYIKQFFWLCLLAGIICPLACPTLIGLWPFVAGLLVLLFVIAFIEVGIAKYRLFKVPDFIIFGVILALLAVVSALLGV